MLFFHQGNKKVVIKNQDTPNMCIALYHHHINFLNYSIKIHLICVLLFVLATQFFYTLLIETHLICVLLNLQFLYSIFDIELKHIWYVYCLPTAYFQNRILVSIETHLICVLLTLAELYSFREIELRHI